MIRFHDPARAEHYDRDGFVVVPLLAPDELDRLRAEFAGAMGGSADDGFTSSASCRDPDESAELSERILAVVGPALRRSIAGFEPIGAVFLAKGSGDHGQLEVHQDWTSVDERTSSSMNVWCALSDVVPDGGCLEFLPGSHRWFGAVRSPSLPSLHLPFSDDLDAALVPVPIAAGSALLYDHRTFHGSRPNRTGVVRPTVQIGLRPSSQPLLMGFARSDGGSELCEVSPHTYFAGGGGPVGPVRAVVDLVPPTAADVMGHLTDLVR